MSPFTLCWGSTARFPPSSKMSNFGTDLRDNHVAQPLSLMSTCKARMWRQALYLQRIVQLTEVSHSAVSIEQLTSCGSSSPCAVSHPTGLAAQASMDIWQTCPDCGRDINMQPPSG